MVKLKGMTIFQSTPPVRGATWWICKAVKLLLEISIHAPRAGGDPKGIPPTLEAVRISIHAPRAGGDLYGVML